MPDKKDLILTKNYASNEKVAKRALAHVNDIWRKTTDARGDLDTRFRQFYNIWNTLFDIKYYEGRSQVYSPQLRKNVEFAVRNTRRNLFPTDDYFTVDSVDEEEEHRASKIKRFLRWQQVNRINLKRYVTPFLRQLFIYGWSPVKVVWQEEYKKIYALEKQTIELKQEQIDPITGLSVKVPIQQEEIVQVQREVPTKQHPSFLPVDIFSFYIYPWTVWDPTDAYACMEEISLTEGQMRLGEKSGIYKNIDEALAAASKVDSDNEHSKRKRMTTLGVSDNIVEQAKERYGIEYWGKFDLMDDGEEIDCLITIMGQIVTQVRQNPHYDQEPPYLVGKLDELVGDFYAKGLIEPLQTVQYFLNDTNNQINDAMTYSLMPILKYQTTALSKSSKLVMAPGAMWALNDINAAEFMTPPDVSQSGLLIAQKAATEIDTYPGFERIPTTGRRPATQIAAIQEDRGVNILDWSENLEVQVMSPFTKKQFMLNQQFLNEEVWFKVLGQKPEVLTIDDMIGNYHFYWLGANQTQNLIVKSRQMLEGLQVALKIPPSPMEMPDYWWIFKKWWKEGMGLDGEEKLVKEINMEAMMDPQQENMILLMGKQLPINELDNDQQHMQIHSQLFQIPELPDAVRNVVETHLKMHMNKLTKMQMMTANTTGGGQAQQTGMGGETNAQMMGGGQS